MQNTNMVSHPMQGKLSWLSKLPDLASITIFFLVALAWSWRAWPDPLVDFGRELYLPWQVSQGQILYQDQAHLFGPLSVYYHAVLFRIFGPSYTILIASNLGIFVILLYLIYNLWSHLSRLSAWISVVITIMIFGFGQYVGIGNYNFLSPYSHEATHGLFLTMLMIHQLGLYFEKARKLNLFWAGLVFGLVFLTRADLFLVALATVACLFLLILRDIKSHGFEIALFLSAAVIPGILFIIFFAANITIRDAGMALLEPWRILASSSVYKNAFYATVTGFNHPLPNLIRAITETLVILFFLGTAILIARFSINYPKLPLLYFGKALWLIGTATVVIISVPNNFGRSLPILCALVLMILFKKRQLGQISKTSSTRLIMWSTFSLTLLLRMPLNSTFAHYGFYLALPAVILLTGWLFWDIPIWINRQVRGSGKIATTLLLIAILLIASQFFARSYTIYNLKNFTLGTGADYFRVFEAKYDPRSLNVAETLYWIENNLNDSETFIAMPEGVMLNYLTRHGNPTPFYNFMPPELVAYSEKKIIDALISHPPDYVLIVHKDTSEYGYGYFGKDPAYGMSIMNWVKQNYHPVCLLGEPPLTNGDFGIEIQVRNYRPISTTILCHHENYD